jgi:hypothetical protein
VNINTENGYFFEDIPFSVFINTCLNFTRVRFEGFFKQILSEKSSVELFIVFV